MNYQNFKRKIGEFLSYIIHRLARLKYKLTDKKLIEKSELFEDLTPYDEMDKKEGGKYFEALEWALANDKIKNIALTGTYGSGKSSILRSFEKLHQKHKYLKISLASFSPDEINPDTEGDEKKDRSSLLNRLIERSILQQIFYTVKPEAIPDSRFKKIYSIKSWKIAFLCILTTIWLTSAVILFDPDLLISIPFWIQLDINITELVSNFAAVIFFLGFGLALFKLYKVLNGLRFSKLNIAKGEIELSNDIDSSILNKHLDEILYFFEVNEYDVVFIEDIDRYDEVDIFAKLRELNVLLNRSEQVGRPINFVYALRDELFDDKKHRTKFFDFIIPIIPVINSNNSKEKLTDRFSDEAVSEDLISDLSLFIDDMRTLKSIYNEYIIYKNKLSTVESGNNQLELDSNQLLAIIIYKNLHPEDFAKLQNGGGMIYKAFHQQKRNAIQERKLAIEKELQSIRNELKEVKSEDLQSVRELRSLYLAEFLKRNSKEQIQNIQIDNSRRSFNELIEDDSVFEDFMKLDNIYYYNNRNRRQSSNISFKQIENYVDSSSPYSKREKNIKKKNNETIKSLEKERERLKRESNEIESKTLEELLQELPKEKVLGGELLDDDFLILLLRNGYIDEGYENYISFFYEGSLKISDKNFLQRVKYKVSSSFDYELINLEEILNNLRPRELEQKEVLNYDLVAYLLENSITHQKALNLVLNQLSDEESQSIEFINGFVKNKPTNKPKFIKLLTQKWNGIWQFIDADSEFTHEKKEKYLDLIIQYSDTDDILTINEVSENSLREFLSNKIDFLDCYGGDEQEDKIKEVVEELSVKFKYLKPPAEESPLFDFIYENSFYAINKDMIHLIISKKADSKELLDQLNAANYSSIKKSNCKKLISYVDENINTYVENVLLENEEKLKEDEEFLIELLNEEELIVEYKHKLIEKQSNPVTSIKKVSSNLWNVLLSQSKIKASWTNLVNYYSKYGKVDSALIEFLNKEEHYKTLKSSKVNEVNVSEETIRKFSTGIILSQDIKDTSYKSLIECVNEKYDDLNFENLNENKVQSLVETGLLNFTVSNYNRLRNEVSPQHIRFIKNNIDSFKDRIKEFTVSEADLKLILNSRDIDNSDKLEILESFEIAQLTIDSELADLILNAIIVKQPHQVSFSLSKILVEEGKTKSHKIKLINSQIDSYKTDQIKQLISVLSYPHNRMVKSLQRPSLDKTDSNLALVENLDSLGIISSYSTNKNKIRVNAKK